MADGRKGGSLLGCLDRPTSGSYLLEGEEVVDMSADQRARLRNRGLGVSPEHSRRSAALH